MKKLLSLFLMISLLTTACLPRAARAQALPEAGNQGRSFSNLSDPALLAYVEDDVYARLVESFSGDDFYIENVRSVYVSKEYLEELAYNSQANIYFGYSLEELDAQFEGTRYVFTLADNGRTAVMELEKYDDTLSQVIQNVAIGSGVILICATVSVVSAGLGAPAMSVIVAASAKSAMTFALSGASISAAISGITTGMQTGDLRQTLKSAALSGSEGFLMGAFSGTVHGGISGAMALKGATLGGLTMNQAASIQAESGYPLDVIKGFKTMEQYNLCKKAGLSPMQINGRTALVRPIDLNFVDEFGQTNLQRMQRGLAALDPDTGLSYDLHHIGQKADSTLSVLSKAEHMQGGNNAIWHEVKPTEIDRLTFRTIREEFWKSLANAQGAV
ncbi:MAG: HNH/ENDO VII family nuclease [Clostridia bacterium]